MKREVSVTDKIIQKETVDECSYFAEKDLPEINRMVCLKTMARRMTF